MNYRHAYHAGNFADVLKRAVLALHRFATGMLAAWLPIEDRTPVTQFYERLRALASVHNALRVELLLRDPAGSPERLKGCAMIVVTPPYDLE